jgi:hypothetical protein
VACAVGVLGVAIAGCGGGGDLTAGETSGTFKVDVVRASFPAQQHLSAASRFVIDVRNAGDKEIHNVAVTLDGFSAVSTHPGAADPTRPVWVVDDGPQAGTTTYVNTWALGRLPAGQTRRFVWRVTAVQPGEHRLRYRVGAGLTGKGQAVTADDSAPEGSVKVHVDREPSQSSVDPATGKVVRQYPAGTS